MNIGSRIRALRIKKGLTQKQLGELCGMADSAIRRYEGNRGNPTTKTIERIATALNVSPLDLIDATRLIEALRDHAQEIPETLAEEKMEEYISREALIEELKSRDFYPAIVRRAIEAIPAADVVAMDRLIDIQNEAYDLGYQACLRYKGLTWDEAKELQRYRQAEAEGRLIVLPCKVGDTVYTIEVFYEGGEWKKRIRDRKFNVSDVEKMGKWIFLSREEAEAALSKDGGQYDCT